MLQLKRIATVVGKIPSSLALKIRIPRKIRLSWVNWSMLLGNKNVVLQVIYLKILFHNLN